MATKTKTRTRQAAWSYTDGVSVLDDGSYRLTVPPRMDDGYGFTVCGPYYPIIHFDSQRHATRAEAKRAAIEYLRRKHKQAAICLAN